MKNNHLLPIALAGGDNRMAGRMQTEPPLILVVDDEEQVSHLAALFLQGAGYHTLKATSGRQALEIWTPKVTMLLTDCAMPDLFGDQLASRLLERNPSLIVVFMSGNSIESLELSVPVEHGKNFLQKPFRSEELLEIVRQALDRKHLIPRG